MDLRANGANSMNVLGYHFIPSWFSLAIWFRFTGVLVLQNAVPLFCTTHLARRNYWADFHEILRRCLLDDSNWDCRGTFLISALEAEKMGVFMFWGWGAKNVKTPIFLASRALIKNRLDESSNLAHRVMHAKFQLIWTGSLVRAMGRVENLLPIL